LKKRDPIRKEWHLDTLTDNEKEKLDSYISGKVLEVNNLKFKPVSNSTWETIGWEGLDEEQDKFKKSDWKEVEFKISKKDSDGLKKMQEEQLEKYNMFDNQLKIKFGMKFTDLIDYDQGKIKIVTAGVEKMYPSFPDRVVEQ